MKLSKFLNEKKDDAFEKYKKMISNYNDKKELESIDAILGVLVKSGQITRPQMNQLADLAYKRLMEI